MVRIYHSVFLLEFIVLNTDTRMDIPLPSVPLPSADEELVTGKADSNECSDDDDASEAASDQGLLLLLVVALVSLTCRQ